MEIKDVSSKKDNEEMYREGWNKMYSIQGNPFDIEEPYEWVLEIAGQGKIKGKVLDSGCGGGHNALYLASKGHEVVGIDISDIAIESAKKRASERGITNATFLVTNVCTFSGFDDSFYTVIDIGCFHSLDGDDFKKYAEALHRACKKDGVLYLRALSDSNKKRDDHKDGGPACSEETIRNSFAEGWAIKHLEEREIEVFVPGKIMQTYAWFAEIRKV